MNDKKYLVTIRGYPDSTYRLCEAECIQRTLELTLPLAEGRVFVEEIKEEEPKDKRGLKTLLESTPIEFRQEFYGTEAFKYKDILVVARHMSHERAWPGSHKYVHSWWELEDGHAVGWNENPSRGWSFPVVKLK